MSNDPTYVPVVTDDRRNPFVKRMSGMAVHPRPYGTPFDVPFISEILPGLYQGGCENGLVLPSNIKHVVSLYQWEKYTLHDDVLAFHEVEMYDSTDGPVRENIIDLANLVNKFRARGDTLVHCQAGLNRSGLVAGAALVLSGMTGYDALRTLRDSRSPAVLCNETFRDWLLDFQP